MLACPVNKINQRIVGQGTKPLMSAPSTPPANASDLPIECDVVGMTRRPAAVVVRYRRVLRRVAFIAMMRCVPGKHGRGSNNRDQDRN
jgi:hypothetical protein